MSLATNLIVETNKKLLVFLVVLIDGGKYFVSNVVGSCCCIHQLAISTFEHFVLVHSY
jgi:hypothetical protein